MRSSRVRRVIGAGWFELLADGFAGDFLRPDAGCRSGCCSDASRRWIGRILDVDRAVFASPTAADRCTKSDRPDRVRHKAPAARPPTPMAARHQASGAFNGGDRLSAGLRGSFRGRFSITREPPRAYWARQAGLLIHVAAPARSIGRRCRCRVRPLVTGDGLSVQPGAAATGGPAVYRSRWLRR